MGKRKIGSQVSDRCPLGYLCLERYSSVYPPRQDYRGFKIPSLQADVTALYVPLPHLFFQKYIKKSLFGCFLRALLASSGEGGHVPLRPPLGPALICGNLKLSRPLRFQNVTISKAFINTYTVLDMVQHDSPRFDLYGKIRVDPEENPAPLCH